jgi:hypothetical protein
MGAGFVWGFDRDGFGEIHLAVELGERDLIHQGAFMIPNLKPPPAEVLSRGTNRLAGECHFGTGIHFAGRDEDYT